MTQPEGRPVSIWTCTRCGCMGIGTVYNVHNCSELSGCMCHLDTDVPDGWLLFPEEVLCLPCYKKECPE